MKLMIIGSGEQHAIEMHYLRYLTERGLQVQLFPAQSIFYNYYNKTIFNKFIFKSGFSKIYKRLGNQLLSEAERFKPDIVWVFKGMELQPVFLEQLRQRGIKLANYNPDNPFLFSGRGSGNENITRAMAFYDVHFTYDHSIREKIVSQYRLPVYMLPFGYDLDDEWYNECKQQEEILKLCFIGNPDPGRAALLRKIAEKIPVDVYGHYWDNFIRHRNILIHSPVYVKEFWKVLYRYRVQLNMMRPHNPDSHNMRSFEIPAIGGVGLYPDTPDHRNFFENGKELFLYTNESNCMRQAEKILNMDAREVMQVRKNARQRSITSGYSYRNRAAFVAEVFNTLVS